MPAKNHILTAARIFLLHLILGGCAPAPVLETDLPLAIPTTTLQVTAQEITQELVLADPSPSEQFQTGTPVVRFATSVGTNVPLIWTPDATFTITPVPTQTLTPTVGPSPRFTRTATLTGTPTSTPSPRDAVLRISRPGLYSRIVSPYKIEAMVTPGEDGFVYMSLIGEGQRVIQSQALDYRRSSYSRFLIVPEILFSIPTVAETARLTLETRDLSGRVMALSSVEIVLLSIGDNETNPPLRLYEPFIIETPKDGALISGGRFVVSGRAAAISSKPLIFELLAENGEIIASRTMQIPVPEGGQTHTPFAVEINYLVNEETNARLLMRQESDTRLPGTIALSSVAVNLFP